MTLGGIHKQVNIQFTLSGGGGLARDRHLAHDRKSPHSQSRVTAVSTTACLLATGILNDLPGLTSCRCNNIGLVSLILLGWELHVLYHSTMCTRRPDLVSLDHPYIPILI